jgi:acetyl-CoA synthetase
MGFGHGDVIALYMPMIPELVIAFLAIIKIGAIILPLFSGYGPGAIVTRLVDANVRAVFTVDGARRRGKKVSMKANIDAVLDQVPSLSHIIVVNRTDLEKVGWNSKHDFWKDKERYIETYWNRFENICVHGDFAAVDEDGLRYILGQ